MFAPSAPTSPIQPLRSRNEDSSSTACSSRTLPRSFEPMHPFRCALRSPSPVDASSTPRWRRSGPTSPAERVSISARRRADSPRAAVPRRGARLCDRRRVRATPWLAATRSQSDEPGATNLADAARHIPATERVVVLTVDLPFISLSKALPQIRDVPFAPGASLIALVKPQFELGLDRPPVALDDLDRAFDTACAGAAAAGWRPLAGMRSLIRGARGSREFFLLAMWRGRWGAE